MGKGNMKGLNPSNRPLNNLNRTTGASTTTEHPSKRQKVDSSFSSTLRLDSSPHASKSQSKSGSSGDVWEIASNSTDATKSGRQSNVASQNQYRALQKYGTVGSSKKGRIRKGRLFRRGVEDSSLEPSDMPEGPRQPPHPVPRDPYKLHDTDDDESLEPAYVDGSSDGDELACDDSTLPLVRSDVVASRGPGKRQRQASISQPRVKRPKTTTTRRESVDNYTDELSMTGNNKSRTGQAQNKVAPPRKESKEESKQDRADIKPTQFESRHEKGNQHPSVVIARAVCSNWTLESTQTKNYSYVPFYDNAGTLVGFQAHLEMVAKGERSVEERDGDEAAISAMRIDFNKIQKVLHNMTSSKYLNISRALSPGRPPNVCIELQNTTECSDLVGTIPPRYCVENTGKPLKDIFEHKWEEAANRQSQHTQRATRRVQAALPDQGKGRSQQSLVVAVPGPRGSRSTSRLIDAMKAGTEEENEERVVSDVAGPPAVSTPAKPVIPSGRQTRRSTTTNPTGTASSPYFAPEPSLTRWTVENPNWESRWHKSLVYPATGRSRAVVDAGDIPRLDDGECLNDNIINFYLKWLKTGLQREKPAVLQKVHVFESYFFERLKTSKYQGVRSWTAKIDLLSYDYIVVPVNESFHWYLAIICNVAKALPDASKEDEGEIDLKNGGETQSNDSSPKVKAIQQRVEAISIDEKAQKSPTSKNNDDPYATPSTPPARRSASVAPKPQAKKTAAAAPKIDLNAPRIITLDSLGNPHSATCKILREYLTQEAKDKKGIELQGALPGMTAKGIPLQGNGYDCGTYTLAFVEKFLNDPDAVSRQLLQKENLDWDVDSGVIRKDTRDLLFTLQEEQQERLEKELAEKKVRRRGKSVSGAVSSPARAATPTASQETHQAAAVKAVTSSPSSSRSRSDSVDVSEVEPQGSTLTAARTPKTGSRASTAPIQNETPRLVSPLANSDDNTAGRRSDAFSSTRGTPTPKANDMIKKQSTPTRSSPRTSSPRRSSTKKTPPQPSLVEEIPSSDEEPEEVRKEDTSKTRKAGPKHSKEPVRHIEQDEKSIKRSVELDDEGPRPKSSGGVSNEAGKGESIQRSVEQDEEVPRPETSGGVLSRVFDKVAGSIWGSPQKKGQRDASYEGIDRS